MLLALQNHYPERRQLRRRTILCSLSKIPLLQVCNAFHHIRAQGEVLLLNLTPWPQLRAKPKLVTSADAERQNHQPRVFGIL